MRDGFGNGNRRREESRSDVTRDVFESFIEVRPLGAPAWGGVVCVCWDVRILEISAKRL